MKTKIQVFLDDVNGEVILQFSGGDTVSYDAESSLARIVTEAVEDYEINSCPVIGCVIGRDNCGH